jgi:hypothetical protein
VGYEDELAKVASEDRVMVATLVQAILRAREAYFIRLSRPDLVDVAEDIADGIISLELGHPHVKGGLNRLLDTVEAASDSAAAAFAGALASGDIVAESTFEDLKAVLAPLTAALKVKGGGVAAEGGVQ